MFPRLPQEHVRLRRMALYKAGVRRWGNHQGRPFKRTGRHNALPLRPKSDVRRPANRIIVAYILNRRLVTMEPAGSKILRQRFGRTFVTVAAPNTDNSQKHGSTVYFKQPARERWRRLSPIYVPNSPHILLSWERITSRSTWYP